MIDDTWPDLSGWHPLPEGGTIPKGTRYARRFSDGEVTVYTATRDFAPLRDASLYRTERPVPVPLPTDEGARIIACDPWGSLAELTLTDGRWRSPDSFDYDDNDIIRWHPLPEWRER